MKPTLQFIFEGGVVERFHARPGVTHQTVAAHSWGVAMLCAVLTDGAASAALLLAALEHDLAEQYTGDTPAPAKWATGTQGTFTALEDRILAQYLGARLELSIDEQLTLKLADTLDGMLHCCREAALGNRTITLIYRKWSARAELLCHTARHLEVLAAVKEIWDESDSSEGPHFDVFAK